MNKADAPETPSQAPEFRPGFRLSVVDIGVLIVGLVACIVMFDRDRQTAWIIAAVVLHFFLFCNVFRLPRSLELIWALVFTCVVAAASVTAWLAWPVAIGVIALLTATVITLGVRRRSYHGVLWATLNPSLPDWFREQHSVQKTEEVSEVK